MSTVAIATKKFKVSSAALAVAAAATLTPVAAQAAPSFAPLAGIGSSASSNVDSVVIPNPAASTSGNAVASATPTENCLATANFKLGCYLVQGAVVGTGILVRGAIVWVGTIAYVAIEGTGQLFKLVGNILPGPIGGFFTNVGDGVSTFGTNFAKTWHVGPYLFS